MLRIRLERSTALPAELAPVLAAPVGFRVGARDAALAARSFLEIAADNFFSIIGVRAMLNRERVRRPIAGPLVAAETTQKLEKTRFRLD